MLALLIGPCGGAVAAETARLAVIADDESLGAADFLLTTELSKQPTVTMLERAEIDRVIREQALSATAAKNHLKLGQVLGADGLLTLELTKEGTNTWLNLRLIAVKPGVALASQRFPWPLPEIEAWAPFAASQLNALLPKLKVLTRDAVPLSILNLRSATQSKEGEELERELTVLLIRRLIHEKPLFVLERRKLQAASQEKSLNADESAFWNGSYLLDGTINKDGISKDKVTVSLRLTPPVGGAAVTVEVAGPRSDLMRVIDNLTRKVLDVLKQTPGDMEWKPADEAKQYAEEGNWALKWGMLNEAQSASEAAWALGLKTRETAELRVKSLTTSPIPILTILTNDRDWNAIYQPQLNQALQATEFFQDSGRTLQIGVTNLDAAWTGVGLGVIDLASRVLQSAYREPSLDSVTTEKLKTIRENILNLVSFLEGYEVTRNLYWSTAENIPPEVLGNQFLNANTVFSLQLTFGKYWHDRPEDTLAAYRKIISGDGFPYVRRRLFGTIEYEPPPSVQIEPIPILASWNPADRKRLPELWRQFVRELISSTNVITQIEGLILALDASGSSWGQNDSGLLECMNSLVNTIQANRLALESHRVDLNYLIDVGEVVRRKVTSGSTPASAGVVLDKTYHESVRPMLMEMSENFRSKHQKKAQQFATSATFLEQKQFLSGLAWTNGNQLSKLRFDLLRLRQSYERTQLEELRMLVTNAHSRALIELASAVEPARGRFFSAHMNLDSTERDLNTMLGLPSPPRLRIGWSNAPNSAATSKTNLVMFIQTNPPMASASSTGPGPALPNGTNPGVGGQLPNSTPSVVSISQQSGSRPQGFPPPGPQAGTPKSGPPISPQPGSSPNVGGVSPPNIILQNDSNVLNVAQHYSSHLTEDDASKPTGEARVQWHAFRENKIWMRLRYTNPSAGIMPQNSLGAMFAVEVGSGRAETLPLPSDPSPGMAELGNPGERITILGTAAFEFMGFHAPETPHSFEVDGDNLYLASPDKLRRYNLRTKAWTLVPVTVQGPIHIHIINHLIYIATTESILQLSEKQDEARILASRRRRPAESPLDELEGLNLPPLFPGPGGTLRTYIQGRAFSWSGTAWSQKFAIDPSATPDLFNDGVLFSVRPSYQLNKLWWLKSQSEELELVLAELPRPQGDKVPRLLRPEAIAVPATWKTIGDLNLTGTTPAIDGTNVLFYVENTAAAPTWQSASETHNTDRRDATLLFCDREFATPVQIPIRFAVKRSSIPTRSPGNPASQMSKPWLLPTPGGLAIGHSSMDGFWFVTRKELDSEVGRRKAALRVANAAKAQALRELENELLAAYDKNHNGTFEADEKGEMISDPKYLRHNWPAIDTNNNRLIDLDELAFFDADGNGVASDKEIDAIGVMLDIAVDDLLMEFDQNKDGGLSGEELSTLAQSIRARSTDRTASFANNPFPASLGASGNGRMGRIELKEMFRSRLFGQLFSGPHVMRPAMATLRASYPTSQFRPETPEGRAACKVALETLWTSQKSSKQPGIASPPKIPPPP